MSASTGRTSYERVGETPGPVGSDLPSWQAMQPIHDDEIATSTDVARSLLASQCPPFAEWPLTPLADTGTSNALWRIHRSGEPDAVLRLPRGSRLEGGVLVEQELLPSLGRSEVGRAYGLPTLLHAGRPAEGFPLHWLVLSWVDGIDAWSARVDLDRREDTLASELATAVRLIGSLEDLPAPERRPGERGGPLGPLLDRLHHWLDDPVWSADGLIDTAAVRRQAARAAEVVAEPPTMGFVHGDLIPGNLLTRDGHLSALIDWGGAGYGDLAQDLTPAWSMLGPSGRRIFRSETGADDASWLRARAFALEQAVGGVLYYRPRGHPLGDVMARTLARLLADD